MPVLHPYLGGNGGLAYWYSCVLPFLMTVRAFGVSRVTHLFDLILPKEVGFVNIVEQDCRLLFVNIVLT